MAMSCPLCCQSISVDLLRTSLISAINRPLICPICGDVQRSLDNLAAHLAHHIEAVPSQIGRHNDSQHDANNVIHNISINNTTVCDESVANQCSDVKRNGDRIMIQKLDAPSLSPVSVHELDTNDQQSRTNSTTIDQIVQPFICNLCECSFRSHELQQMHMQLVHEINIRPSNEYSKLANARAISSSMLQCSLCPKRFKMIGSLRLHVRMVHGVSHVPQNIRTTENTLICETTSNNLVASTGNDQVMETGDLIASTSSSLHVSPVNRSLVHNNLSDYYRNYGLNDASFGTNSSTISNSIVDSSNDGGGGCDEHKGNDGPSNGNNNSKEIVNTEDSVHKCDICNKRFTTKYFLKKHKRLHTGEMPYTCELCHRTFTFQQSYHRHLSYHTNDRPHSCSICGRAFKELSTLHNHQRIHSGEKPFECENCGKCFRQRVSYLVHRRIHTGVMPYDCVTCDKKFRYKISLRTHKCTGFTSSSSNEHTSTTVNNDAVTFIDNINGDNDSDQQSMSTCQQTLDELITELCNRMGIVDRTDPNQSESSPYANTSHTETDGNHINHSMLHFECDSFNLNDLTFCTGESNNTDLANVIPSMNEIFPQSIEILNALYHNASANSGGDLHHFYDSSQQPPQQQ